MQGWYTRLPSHATCLLGYKAKPFSTMGMHTTCTTWSKEINALFLFLVVGSSLEQSLGFFSALLSAMPGTAGRLVHLVVPAAQRPCPRAQLASGLLSGEYLGFSHHCPC